MKFNSKLVLASLLAATTFGASFDIQDRILSQKVLLDNYKSAFGQRDFAHKTTFLKKLDRMSFRKKKPILKFIKEKTKE